MWMWIFLFSFFISMVGLMVGVFFFDSVYLISWSVSVFREMNFEMLIFLDSFSMVLFFTVGMVSGFVLLYSNYYMGESMFKKKFVITMMVFIISMMILSVSGDLFWVMIGWDGLGFSSMCLIFFFQNWKSFNSAVVTFVSNRIGDFLIISFFCFYILINGSLFCEEGVSSMILGVLLCFGAFSKSAQVPFSAWLPLAMAAPTPVSSLVHSSTLVTAGVFLLIRFKSFLCEGMYKLVFFVSFITVLLAGMSSVGEYDLKKVIALSTLSHIGLMMMFVGMESFVSAKIHLVIHAFFKSLLFMISGFIIHDNNNFQDIRMISVSSKNEFFSMTFLLSVLSMMGAPFLSGFFSKEILLSWVFGSVESLVSIVLFFFSVGMTCSYSMRMLIYFFLPSFSCLPLISGDGYPMKFFFFMSIMSSFSSGLVICSFLSKGEVFTISSFSLFQKVSLVSSIIFGMILSGVFSFYISFLNWWILKLSQMMWMIGSVNYVSQGTSFNFSFFFLIIMIIKGMLDYLIFIFWGIMSFFSKIFLSSLYVDPFVYFKICCFIGMVLFFFI